MQNKWEEFHKLTTGFTSPAMIKNILDQNECEILLNLLSECTQEFAKKNKPHNGLKSFKNRLQDNDINESLLLDPPLENESLKQWSERFFKGEPFGMIMNFIELYNNQIVEFMGNKLAPLIQLNGMPWAGLSMLFFMGDYGFTPFGVHRGSPGEDGILFHLGPAKKTFYIWETEDYNNLTNHASSYANVDEILHAAKAYVLEPGDAISFPDDMYHVANTEDFSVSLVLDYRKATKLTIKDIIIDQLKKVEPEKTEILDHVSETNLLEELNFFEESKTAVERMKLRLESNGGFFESSRRKFFTPDLNSSYRLKPPFTIKLLALKNNKISLFLRGHEIVINKTQKNLEIIDTLNAGKVLDVSKLGIDLSQKDNDTSVFEMLIKLGETDGFIKI